MTIRVERFSGAAGVRALAPGWQALTAQIRPRRHFHHVEWYLALADTLEKHGLTPLSCIAVFANNALVAVLPYRQERLQVGPYALRLMKLVSDQGEGETARDFMMAPALAQSNFFQGLVRFLAQHDTSWDVISLHGILEDSVAATALENSPQLTFFQTPGGALDRGRIYFISCGDADRPLDRVSKVFKKNLRKSHNRTKSENVAFAIARTEAELKSLLPQFLRVESSGWKGAMGTSALKDAATNTFIEQLIAQFGPKGECELRVMRIGDKTAAALFGIVTDDVWYMFRIGYDESFDRASPGHLIIEHLLDSRTAHPSFSAITPYNAPDWFAAWKPDRILNIYNSYVFRPSAEGINLARQIELFVRGLNVPITVPVKSGQENAGGQ
jgi:CelD/BcsL family acetyltransferase involved in cellulose biosynthesis